MSLREDLVDFGLNPRGRVIRGALRLDAGRSPEWECPLCGGRPADEPAMVAHLRAAHGTGGDRRWR